MFEYFYNEIIRRTIISFGTLFNTITIKNEGSVTRVPLAYGPIQKFLARIEQSPDLNKPMAITLPRMSFEYTGMTYDPTRKLTQTQQIVVKNPADGTDIKKQFVPVPYNMQFELGIMCKLNDDALQIVEQILPFFQPAYNISVELVSSIKEKRDVPVILESVTMQDDYEGDYTSRRVLLYTLRFTAKTYLFGPVQSASKDIIKKATVNYVAGGANATERDVTYSVTPRATKDYTGDVLTNITQDITATAKTIQVADGTQITAEKYIALGQEEIYVKSVNDNKLTVRRGQDSTLATAHLNGAEIKGIDYTDTTTSIGTIGVDSALVEEGDDFGFSGTYS